MNPEVDWFFQKAEKWQEELLQLRRIVLECGLTEELKWGVPCYTCQQKNIVLIHAFKDYFAFLFHKGALLSDTSGILVQQTENVQSARQIRFTGMPDITEREALLRTYIYEAIEVEKAGLKVTLKKVSEDNMPDELKAKLEQNPALKSAFRQLTPGRQRGYLLYFSEPKQSKTRESRIQKCMPKILDGKGLNDN